MITQNQKLKVKNQKLGIFAFVFFIFYFLSFIFPVPAQADIPLAPIQPGLREEILGIGEQAAVVGLGQQALEQIDLRVYALRLVRGALAWVGLALLALILYGGFLYMTSGGNEEKIETAKKVLARAAIGAAIILSSYAITIFITRRVVRIMFETMITQTQRCGAGVATCCGEWNAYQNALSSVPSLIQGASDIAEQYEEQTRQTRELYARWRECWDRETERAGLPSNLF